MSCERTRAELADYLVGALAADAQEALEAHLVACAACATELARLAELEDDLLALGRGEDTAPVTKATPRGGWGWQGWVGLAAAVLLGLGLGLVLRAARAPSAAPRIGSGVLASMTPGAPLPFGRALHLTRASVLGLSDGSRVEAAAGAKLELLAPRQVRLLAGMARFRVAHGDGPFDVHTPRVRVRALGTIFDVKIEEVSMNSTKLAAAGAAVVISVAAGVVLVTSNDGTQEPVRLEAGQRAVASAGSIERVGAEEDGVAPVGTTATTGGPEVSTLRAEAKRQQEKIAELEREKAQLAKRVAELEQAAGGGVTPRTPGSAPVAYGRWGEDEALAGIDWKKSGAAAHKMLGLIGKLLEALDAGKRPSSELGIEIAKANQVLAAAALSINGKVPTNVSGNGEYTHPYVLGNMMASELKDAGQGLSAAQVRELQRLGEAYDAAWQVQQQGYDERTWKLKKVLDEAELKQRLFARFRAGLSEAQKDAIGGSDLANLTRLDILSPAAMFNGLASPIRVDSAAELPARLTKLAASQLGVKADDLAPYANVIDRWVRAVQLAPVPSSRVGFIPFDAVVAAGRAQLKALQDLALQLNVGDAQLEKLREGMGIFVPRLVQSAKQD